MKKIYTVILLSLGFIVYVTMSSNISGITGQSAAGCNNGSCHGNANPSTVISLIGFPITGYVPGQAYVLTLTASNTSYTAPGCGAGFDLKVSNGTISNAPANTAIVGGTEIHHTAPQPLTTNTASWVFTWTAPATFSGNVTINVSCNVVNGNGQNTGDAWKTSQFTVLQGSMDPKVISSVASGITANSAGLSFIVMPGNNTVNVITEYGLSTSYGSSNPANPSVVSGTTNQNVTSALSGLAPNKLYHYRLKMTVGGNSTFSNDYTFTTSASGIIEMEQTHLKVYPNPVTEVMNVALPSSMGKLQSVAFISIDGKLIDLPWSIQNQMIQVNTAQLPVGNYILQVKTDQKNATQLISKE